jgi:hypothetical protein
MRVDRLLPESSCGSVACLDRDLRLELGGVRYGEGSDREDKSLNPEESDIVPLAEPI